MLRNLQRDLLAVERIVDNPEATETYPLNTPQSKPLSIVNSSESYDYIVITDATLNSSFQPLVNWKIQKGLNAKTVLIEDILSNSNYSCDGPFGDGCTSEFNNTAARIRNFVKDAYLNWGIEYVLLGGDVQIIEHRGMYGYVGTDPPEITYNIPTDMYFGALDGSWDNDNDTVFGEGVQSEAGGPSNGTAGEEADWYAEVYVGRAPVTTPEQVQNFVNKTLWYEQCTDDSFFKKAVMIGETLDEETEAGNSKDLVSGEIPQYTTTRLYERDGTYSRGAITSTINNGVHILNHDGHCNADFMMDMDRADIDTLITNTENFFFGYSVGCYAAAFDGDSVVEHFVRNPTGSFAFISNSRYGWYSPGTLLGSGDRFDRKFFDVLNNTVANLGKTLQFSKEYFAATTSNSMRWTYYELNLLGDPETEIVTEIEAPTAHFDTNPTAERLDPPTIKGLVNLTGYARRGGAPSATFSNYTIEYLKGTWRTDGITLVNNGQSEITDDVLATWDTRVVDPGLTYLKLTVTNATGTVGVDKWMVEVVELPAIRVDPQLTETYAGLNFTISIKITDPEDLYGIEFQLRWNTTLVDYLNHALYMPVQNYWWGVLHDPVQISTDEVNETAGTYRVAAESLSSTPCESNGIVLNMTFHANTNGTCNLEISASNLTDRFDQSIFHKTLDGVVEIEPGIHDVAAGAIIYTKTIVGEGYSTRINVAVANEGTYAEVFNFTAYANTTEINVSQISLAPLSQETITITWDTTSFAYGNYTISLQIDPVQNETDTVDNDSLSTEVISISIPGDVDASRKVDIFDIVRIAGSYMKGEGDPGFDTNNDIDDTGLINIFDVVIAAGNYLESWP